jgi:hypothetical protein
MDESDMNIYNYDIDEILHLFKLEYNYKKTDLLKCKETVLTLHPHNSQLDPTIFDFYNRAYKIVDCLHDVRSKKLLLNASYFPNPSDDAYFLSKIRMIPNFEKEENNELLIHKIFKEDKNDILYKALEQQQESSKSPHHRPIISDETQDDTHYTNTFNNPVVSSSLNSIKRVTVTKNLHMNSCFRTKYYTTNPCDFQYHFPSEVKNIVALRLASIEVPNSWYLFSHVKHNSKFKMEVKIGGKCSAFVIVIPDGNYDCDSIAHYLNTEYFYESQRTDELRYIKFSINEYNFKTVFELVNTHDIGDTPIQFSLYLTDDDDDNIMNTMGWILGFRLGKYLEISEAIQSEGIFDAGGDRYIYFCLNDYQYNKNESNIIFFEDSTMDENVLAKIPMVNGKLNLVVDDNDGNSLIKTRRFNGPVNMKKVHIRLLDKFGEIIDLNKMDFSFTLEMELLYERNKII